MHDPDNEPRAEIGILRNPVFGCSTDTKNVTLRFSLETIHGWTDQEISSIAAIDLLTAEQITDIDSLDGLPVLIRYKDRLITYAGPLHNR